MPIAQTSSKHQADVIRSTKTMNKKSESESVEATKEQTTTSSGTKTPPEQPEFIKQTLIIIEKKARNLDKRRQKLEEYKASELKGAVLNEDQLLAVSKYEEVLRTLELSRELEKQFMALANDVMKQQKKQLKREEMAKEENMKEKLKEINRYFSVLEKFADDKVRNDFLVENNGAIKMTQNELDLLDAFDKLVSPCELGAKLESGSGEFADHLYNLIEAKNKPINTLTTQITYAELKKLFERILAAPYWTEEPKKEEEEAVVAEETQPEAVREDTPAAETLTTAVEGMNLNEQQQESEHEQATYNNQNVDDYVIVSSSECTESLCHSKSPSLQPQQQPQPEHHHTEQVPQDMSQQKTFFSTLNQPEQRNINEFINSCENNDGGINFFQDSELQRQQQEQMQHQQTEMSYEQHQQPQEGHFNQQQIQNDGQRDQYKHRGQNGQRPYQQRGDRRYQDDRRNGNNGQQPRNDNRGPRPNRGGANSGPRNDANGQRGPYRGGQNGGMRNENGPRYNGPRNTNSNFQQQ